MPSISSKLARLRSGGSSKPKEADDAVDVDGEDRSLRHRSSLFAARDAGSHEPLIGISSPQAKLTGASAIHSKERP
jgi:hypothetical protein